MSIFVEVVPKRYELLSQEEMIEQKHTIFNEDLGKHQVPTISAIIPLEDFEWYRRIGDTGKFVGYSQEEVDMDYKVVNGFMV
jgi:hypothetical protein